MIRQYGWKRDTVQPTRTYSVGHLPPPPTSSNNLPLMPPVWDQGQTSSCTGHGSIGAYMWRAKKQGLREVMFSRLFAYALARITEGDLAEDAGAAIHDVVVGLAYYGVCTESLWPFTNEDVTAKPSAEAYADAIHHRVTSHESVLQDLTHIKQVLAFEGPIISGSTLFTAFESEEVAKTGVVPMPDSSQQQIGGHCYDIVDYDDKKWPDHFLCRNSWSTNWGINGYFLMPFEYILEPGLSSDLRVITGVQPYQ